MRRASPTLAWRSTTIGRRLVATSGVLLMAILGKAAVAAGDSGYRFLSADETIVEPWHKSYLELTPTPATEPNAAADYLNSFLRAALGDELEKTAARSSWRDYSKFLNWAVWGYRSPDSAFQGDERLVGMMRVWLEALLERLAIRPEDPRQAENWVPNRILDSWSFHDYSLPLLALDEAPELRAAIGNDLVDRYRQTVIASIESMTGPEQYNDLIARAETYVNMATHPMAVYIHGWLLTGEPKYLRMAQSIVTILHRDQMPNGMFPYRYRIHGERHLEYETMYYHAINVRALYLYWWATGSELALTCLRRSAPWYPLNLEPPWHFNDGPDIWWKDQWRTFWPMHVAMKAAATGDGENATIARRMAVDKVSHDRFDLVLGAHAYRRMASVASVPVRDGYVILDPDIRGLRLRFAPWSATFTVGSFTYTRASAMLVRPDGKGFDALHLARPCVRVAPLQTASRVDPDYTTLGASGADSDTVISGNAAAAGTVYALSLTPETWAEHQPMAPWRMAELWLMTPGGAIGLIDSLALEAQPAFEFSHQYRFIVADNDWRETGTADTWQAGGLELRVWATDFACRVVERVRRYALNPNDRRDYQVSLVDRPRLPEEVAQQPPEADEANTDRSSGLPAMTSYPAGYRRYSLVSVAPVGGALPLEVTRVEHPRLVGFTCSWGGERQDVLLNPTSEAVSLADAATGAAVDIPPGRVRLVRSAIVSRTETPQ